MRVLRFRVLGFGLWALGVGCWVLGVGFWVLGFGFWVLGFGFWVLGFRSTQPLEPKFLTPLTQGPPPPECSSP